MPQTMTPESALAANLGCLGRRNAELREKLAAVEPRSDVVFTHTPQKTLSVAIGTTALCSRHRPLDEAAQLAGQVDLVEHAVIVVLGFGAGYHVRALAERLGTSGIIVVLEPDLGLLRAVLERIDHSSWMKSAQLLFVTDAGDRGTLARKLEGTESIIAQGVAFVEHPPSRHRMRDSSRRFTEIFTELVTASKITFMTTLMRSVDTVRNLLLNLDHYAGGAGLVDLEQAAAGRLGIVVSAGPSLHRALDLLAAPGVRQRAVIIAAQTTLRPLLAAGVRPHFVTALDFHEISRRFYEDLTPDDVRDVTLVAEAKAHPVIFDLFPGPIRCCANEFLDQVLGEHARPMGTLPAGATVAHLAVYLAHYLGCNPIALVGQDLAFTDGLYYAPGTAIDEVWAPELNAFNTIEMMQWQRIARHRTHLSRVTGVDGKPVYTDGQMLTYLHQFERDFAGYREAGIEIIDATGGGLVKQHTTAMSLADVLDRYATTPLPAMPLPPGPSTPDPRRLVAARDRIARLRADVAVIQETSSKTASLLRRMIRDHADKKKMARHFGSLRRYRSAIDRRMDAFRILNHLNQLGVYKRHRADRRLLMQTDLDGPRQQQAQLQRDLDNVTWTGEAAGELVNQLGLTDRVLAGERITAAQQSGTALLDDLRVTPGEGPARVAAIVAVDPDRNGLGIRRSVAEPFAGRPVIQQTLERLGAAHELDSIILIVPDGFEIDALIDTGRIGRPVHIHRCDGSPYGPEQAAIAAARRWSVSSWRGGIAGMSIYDEVLCPALMSRVMRERGLTAALVAGPDWPLIDPDSSTGLGAIVERHLQFPTQHKLVFSQAPPGLGGCLVSASLMEELTLRNRLSTIGGLLVYQPQAPQHDPIARSVNVMVDHRVRRSRLRATFDAPRYRRLLQATFGSNAGTGLSAAALVAALEEHAAGEPQQLPRDVVVELTTRRTGGAAGDRPDLDVALAERLFGQIAEPGDVVVTFAGAGDPLLHENFDELVRLARDAGVAGVHVRTELLVGHAVLDRLLACEPDVVSVDLHADCPGTYSRVTGFDGHEIAVSGMHHLVTHRRRLTDHSPTAALALPWIVPRMARRPETLDEIDGFFERWQANLGAVMIDPQPDDVPAESALLPVVVPRTVRLDEDRHTMTVLSDGSVPVDGHTPDADVVGTIADAPVAELWSKVRRGRNRGTVDP